ncbi:MAG: hypothetical protein WCJ33_01305 [Pseudomonadota bacterium]
MSAQLTFNWKIEDSYLSDDFIVSKSNLNAVNFINELPQKATSNGALLYGMLDSGKTHLSKIWLEKNDASLIDKSQIGILSSQEICQNNNIILLEDIETINNEEALFHLMRHIETQKLFLLITANCAANQLNFKLPDLMSRLIALPSAIINSPDENLLQIITTKWFSDRQLRVNNEIINYIITRSERSFSSIRMIIEKIEKLSLETKREITIPLVKMVL